VAAPGAVAQAALAAKDWERCAELAARAALGVADGDVRGRARWQLLEGLCRGRAGQPGAALTALGYAWDHLPDGSGRALAARLARRLALRELRPSEVASLSGRIVGDLPRAWLGLRMATLAEQRGETAVALARLEAVAPALLAVRAERHLRGMRRRLSADSPLVSRRVGALLPLTGGLRRVGRGALRGLLLATGALGNDAPPLHVLVRDTAGDPVRTTAALDSLAGDERVSAVLGPLDRRTAAAAAGRAQAAGLPLLTLTVDRGVPGAGPFVFRNGADVAAEAADSARYAVRRLGLVRAAVLHPDNAYGRRMRDLFEQAYRAEGGQVVRSVSYGSRDVTFGKPLASLASAPPFSALFVPDVHARVALLAPHLAAAHFVSTYAARPPRTAPNAQVVDRPVQLLGSGAWYDDKLLSHGAVRYLDGAIFPASFFAEAERPEVIHLVTAAMAAGGGRPGPFTAYAYDSARLLGAVLSDPRASSREAVRDLLDGVTGHPGVTSTTGFAPDRNPEGEPTMAMISERGFTPAP